MNILLMWISEPCIVFGRHQNPWLECNVKESLKKGVKIVRRYSGGGCVYHDLGNLNISFITERTKYNRKFNLNILKNSLDQISLSGCEIDISPRYDIFLIENKQQTQTIKSQSSVICIYYVISFHFVFFTFLFFYLFIFSILTSSREIIYNL
jgi:hypothetical protein